MANTIVSSQVLLFVNGALIGRVSDFTWTSTTTNVPIYGLDVGFPLELAPGTVFVQGSMTVYRTLGDGGAEGMGVQTQFPDAMRQQYVQLELRERTTGLSLFRCPYAKFNTQQWGAAAKGLMQGTLSFSGITWTNEIAQAPQ